MTASSAHELLAVKEEEVSKDKASREADESLASMTSRQLASRRLTSSSWRSGQIQIHGNDDDDYNQDRRVS